MSPVPLPPDRALAPNPFDFLPPTGSFQVTSTDVAEGVQMSLAHVYPDAGGENQSPAVAWSGFPDETASFAVSCFDVDAPTVGGWYHWFVLDIPTSVTSLARDAGSADGSGLPAGAIQLASSYGTPGYGGPYPPPGETLLHRYLLVVHALDVATLGVPAEATPNYASFQVTQHEIARGVLVPKY